MLTCVDVLYELNKIDGNKREMLSQRARKGEIEAYKEIERLLTLLERKGE